MNLVDDAWIPVIYKNKKETMVSLSTLFKDAVKIEDVRVNVTERVGIFSLLLAIIHDALDGPEDYDDWYSCKERIPKAVQEYLKTNKPSFNLFGKHSFLSIENLEPEPLPKDAKDVFINILDKISYEITSGNNFIFFDKIKGPRKHTYAWIVRQLFSYQNFDCGGLHSKATWNGKLPKVKSGGSFCSSPRFSALHTYILEDDLLSTLHMNLLNKKEIKEEKNLKWGVPIWKKKPKGFNDYEAKDNLLGSYLGMLVPLSRSVRVHENGVNCVLGNGFTYPRYEENLKRIATATVVAGNDKKKQPQYRYLKLAPGKHPWRELGSICSIANWDPNSETRESPLALNNIMYLLDKQDVINKRPNFRLWAGQLDSEKSKVWGKPEWVLNIESFLLYNTKDENGVSVKQRPLDAYRKGVEYAENISRRLLGAVLTYREKLGDISFKDNVQSSNYASVKGSFWHALDVNHELLMKESLKTEKLENTEWYKFVLKTAISAYKAQCTTASARHIEAYVKGIQVLVPRQKENEYMPKRDSETDKFALKWTKFLLSQKNDRGMLAQFRNLIRNDNRLPASFGGVVSKQELENRRLREACVITAAIFGHNTSHVNYGNMGKTLKCIKKSHNTIELRFRALLDSRTRIDLKKRLYSFNSILSNKKEGINYTQLFLDIYFWGDAVKRRWGESYWLEVKKSKKE